MTPEELEEISRRLAVLQSAFESLAAAGLAVGVMKMPALPGSTRPPIVLLVLESVTYDGALYYTTTTTNAR